MLFLSVCMAGFVQNKVNEGVSKPNRGNTMHDEPSN